MEHLNYEKGELGYITRWVDRGFLTITLDDARRMTPFQLIAFKVIDYEIMKWRSNQKPMVTY